MTSHKNTLLLATFSLAVSCACAQTAPKPVDTIVVVDSPIIDANSISEFATFSTQVSEAQIRDLGALDLAAALRMTPGMQISRYNEVGSYSGDQGGNVYIRGTGASRPGGEIKTYIDNVPVYMGLWNHPLMDMLPLNGMASIHILKGPQPQAGGNNFAAINMVSKRLAADGMNAQADLSAGSFGTRTLHAIIVGRQEGFDYLLAAGHVESDGDRANSDGKLDNAYGRLGFRLSEQWSVGLGFLSVDNEVGDPGDNRFAVSKTAIGPYSFSNGVARNRTDANLVYGTLAHRHGTWDR
jgi:outer membrane receptor for Fe3+-dicitrate